MTTRDTPIISAGLLLGGGLGGSLDALALHQVLRWHDLLARGRPATDLVALTWGMMGEGLFLACAWTMTVAGVWRLWTAARRGDARWSTGCFAGALLAGWGIIDIVVAASGQRLVDAPRALAGHSAWALGLLALGVAQTLVGLLVVRRGARPASATGGSVAAIDVATAESTAG